MDTRMILEKYAGVNCKIKCFKVWSYTVCVGNTRTHGFVLQDCLKKLKCVCANITINFFNSQFLFSAKICLICNRMFGLIEKLVGISLQFQNK